MCSEVGLHCLGLSPVSGRDAFHHSQRTWDSQGLNWECINSFGAHGFSEERKPCCSYKIFKPVQCLEIRHFSAGMFPPSFNLIHNSLCAASAHAGNHGKSLSEVKQLKSL